MSQTSGRDLSGTRLGRFTITGRISADADDPRYLARADGEPGLFAVRPLGSAQHRPRSYWEELMREADLAKQLSHPHLLRVLEYGEYEGERYLVAEHVQGIRLDQLLDQLARERDHLELSEVLGIGLALADTVAFFQSRSAEDGASPFVHGRITPSNTILSHTGVPRLGGFADPGSADLAYQAPEQLLGIPPDGRSDVFSLAVILLELLTGRRLFQRSDPAATIGAILGGAVVPALDTVEPAFRPPVAQLFEQALARDRDQRHPSGRAFHAALFDLASQREFELSPRSPAITRHLTGIPSPPPTSESVVPAASTLTTGVDEIVPTAALAPPEKRSTLARVAMVAAMVALLGLVAGGLVYLGSRTLTPEPSLPPTPVVDTPAPDDALSRAHRFAGLQALESGAYDASVEAFEAALAAPNPSSDLPRLLAIARNLQLRAQSPSKTKPDPEAPKETPVQEPTGLLLVTTDPPRLIISIDGDVREMSPARLELAPGRHRLAISKGTQVLFRRPIVIRKDDVLPMNLDLAERLAALDPAPRSREASPKSENRDALAAAAPSSAESATTSSERRDVRSRGVLAGLGLGNDPKSTEPPPADAAPTEAEGEAPIPPAPLDSNPEATSSPARPPGTRAEAPPLTEVPSATVRTVMNSASARFRRCYDRQLRLDDTFQGTVMLVMQVGARGRVGSVDMDSTLDNQRVEACLRREIDRVRFPPHQAPGPIPARFRLVFKPS